MQQGSAYFGLILECQIVVRTSYSCGRKAPLCAAISFGRLVVIQYLSQSTSLAAGLMKPSIIQKSVILGKK